MPKTVANRHDELRCQLEALHLDAFAQGFAELALRAAKEGLSHEAYLYELVKLQRERREQRRVQRLLYQAGLPHEKTFRTLDLNAFPAPLRLQLERLKSGTFLSETANIVAIGKPGVGKSHALAAVAYELVQAGQPVLWTATSTLVQRLLAAKRDLRAAPANWRSWIASPASSSTTLAMCSRIARRWRSFSRFWLSATNADRWALRPISFSRTGSASSKTR